MTGKTIFCLAGISGALAVGLGAFGAHGLEALLTQNGRLDTFQTAVSYHFYHTLLLVAVGILAFFNPQWKGYSLVTWLLIIGICFFSGSLYILSLTGITWLGAIAPIGGLAFILAWASLIYIAVKNT